MAIKFKVNSTPRPRNLVEATTLPKELVSNHTNLLAFFVELTKARTKKQIFKLVTSHCLKNFNIDAVLIQIPDEDNKNLLTESFDFNSKVISKEIVKVRIIQRTPLTLEYPSSKAFLIRKFVHGGSKELPAIIRRFGIKMNLSFPIVVKNRSLGVLSLVGKSNYDVSADDLKILHLATLFVGEKLESLDLLSSLKKHSAEMEVVQNSIKEGLSLHGKDGVIYYANKTVSKLFGTSRKTTGLKREDLIKNWDRYHRYKLERYFEASQMHQAVYQDKKQFVGVMKIFSNPVRFVEANYIPIVKEGSLIGMAASYRDITRERRQEEQINLQVRSLQTEKDRWKAMFQNVDEGICILDRTGRIEHINASCEAALGRNLKEVQGKEYSQVFGCHTKDGLRYPEFRPLEKLIITREPIPYDEHLHTNAQGFGYWVGVSATPIKNQEGEIEEIILVVRDISAMKEIEKAKSEFVSIASHELRTPLTVVNGYLSLLLSGDLGDFADVQSRSNLFTILRKVSDETSRLTKLVSDLLNVSRIEEKRIQLEVRSVPIAEIIHPVVEEMAPLAAQKNITLKMETLNEPDGLTVRADRNKVTQVLVNLVDNAVKYTPTGGNVWVRYWQEKHKAFVQVEDNGIGIPEKLFPIIFEKFQQAPGSYLKENRGTGLGLFIVKSLVELHNGGMNVESEVGRGTKFTFYLPTA